LYEKQGRIAEAEQLYWRQLNAEETLEGRMGRLGDLIRLHQNSNLNKLIRELEVRAENSPTAAFPLLGLAECYRVNNRANERAEVLDRVLELRPNDVTVLRAKAALEEDLGDYALMLRVADLEPAGGAYAKIVEFEILYGDPTIAKMMMEDPRVAEDLDNFIDLAARLIAAGTSEPIANRLERLAAEHPKDYRLAYLRGCLLEEAERPSEAARVFAPLLGVEEERPGAGSGSGWSAFTSSNPHQVHSNMEPHRRQMVAQWRIQYGATISDELLEMYSLAMYGANGRRGSQRYGSAPRRVDVPDTLEELESNVLLKLGELVSKVPPEERVELTAVLDESKPYVGLLSVRSASGVHSEDWWNAAVERYPDDEDVRLMRVFVASHTINTEEKYKELIAEFSEEYPELALVTLTRASHRYPDLLSMLPAVAANTGVTDDNLELLTRSCVAGLARVPSTNEAYQAAVELFNKIEARNLENDELKVDVKLMLAASRARIDNDFSDLLDLAEESFNTPPEVTAPPMGTRTIAQWRHNRPIHFPPYMLPNANARAVYVGLGKGKENEDQIKALMDRPADSLFRWLALSCLGAEAETLAAAAEAVAAKEPKTEDELYALMSWSAVSNNVERAVGYALEARAFPEGDKDRRAVRDRDLITLVSRLDEIPEERREELVAVKKELDSSVLWSERDTRMFVIDFYDRVGVPLKEIERRLSYSPGASSAYSARWTSTRRSTYRPPDFYQQFRSAVDQQTELDAALTRVAVLTRSEALLAIHPSGRRQSRNHRTLQNCVQYLKERELADRYLALFTPTDREPLAREMFERAYALELMGREEEALEAYGEIVAARPDWSGPRSRYCVALAAKDPEKALKLMNELPSSRRVALVEAYQQRFYDNNASFEDRVAMVELIVGMLESGESLDETIIQRYVDTLFNAARNNWHQNQRDANQNAMLPALNHASEEGSLGADWTPPRKLLVGNMAYWKDESSTDAQRRRREAHVRALKMGASMESNLAQMYYSRWTAYVDFTDAPVEESEFFTLARALLANAGQTHHYIDSAERGERRDPLEVYVDELRRRADWSDAETLLTEMNGAPQKKGLQTLMELNAAESAGDYTNRLAAAMEAETVRYGSSPWLTLAFKYHVEDDRPGDLRKMVWARLDATAKTPSYASAARSVIALAKVADEVGVDVAELFEHFLEKLFTPAEREIIAKAASGGIDHMTSSSIYSKYHQISSAFNGVDLPPESLSRFLTVMAPYERKMSNAFLSRNLANQVANRVTDVEWMKGMGFFGTVDEFPFIAFSGGSQSMARQLCDRVNGDAGKPLVDAASDLEIPTFGGDVMKALVGNSSWNKRLTDLIAALGAHQDALTAAPEKAEALYDWIVEMESYRRATINTKSFSADAMRAHEAFLAWKRSAAARRADDLEAFGVSDFARDPYGKQNFVRSVIAPLIESDPERARAVFARSHRMLKLAYLAQGNRGYDDRQIMSQIFQRPTYSVGEVRFVAAAVADMNSASAYQWLSGSYVQRMGSNLEQRHRERGLDQRSARAAAGKETLEILLPMGDEVSAQGVLGGLSRVDQRDRTELANWLAEQEFPDSAASRLATIYLDPKNADEEWLRTYFVDVDHSAPDRFKAYSMLNGLGNNKPEILKDSAVLFDLVDVVERDAAAQLPRDPFKELLKNVDAMEEGEEKKTWIDRCLALWRSERVEGGSSNWDTCYSMAEFAAKVGRLEDARLIISTPQLAKMPSTYAVAIRSGMDDFVVERLPGALLGMNNSYTSNEAWIRVEDAVRRDEILSRIEDPAERLMTEILIVGLRRRDGKKLNNVSVDDLQPLLERAVEELDDPAHVRWVALIMKGLNVNKNVDAINAKFIQTSSIRDALNSKNGGLMGLYISHIQRLAAETNLVALTQTADDLKPIVRDDALNGYPKRLCDALVGAALNSGDEVLWDKGLEIGLQLQSARNPNQPARKGDVLREHGFITFEPGAYGFEELDDVNRYNAYEQLDSRGKSWLTKRFEQQSKSAAAGGSVDGSVKSRIRIGMMGEWLENAGADGFLPLRQHVVDGLRLSSANNDELKAVETWLLEQEDSLMLAQLKACVSYVRLKKRKWKAEGTGMEDLSVYLNRDDLDVAEKTRWLVHLKSVAFVFFQTHFEDETLAALLASEDLATEWSGELLSAFPLPRSKAVFPLYNQYADGCLKQVEEMPLEKKREWNTRNAQSSVLITFFALGRTNDALTVMNEEGLRLNGVPAVFEVAVANGQEAWCAENIGALTRSFLPRNRHAVILEENPALRTIAKADPNPDVRLAADLLLTELATDTRRGAKPDFGTLERVTAHEFADGLCAIQARRLLELHGYLEPPAVDSNAVKWYAACGGPALLKCVGEFNPVERVAFARYTRGLIAEGRMDEVIALYTIIAENALTQNTISWLVKLPFVEAVRLATASKKGAVSPPAEYESIDAEQWLPLLDLIDGFHGEGNSVVKNSDFGDSAMALCALAGQPGKFERYKRKVTPVRTAFELTVLYAGVHNGDPDGVKSREAIERYVDAIKWFKEKSGDSRMKNVKWNDVAKTMLNTHPYRENKEMWFEALNELIPEELNRKKLGIKVPEKDVVTEPIDEVQ
jgi:hypothetical protein